MNETLIRALSGAVYILLLLSCILYSNITFYILFGLFLALAVLEFCKLIKLNYVIPLIIAIVSYIIFYNTPFNQFYDGSITLVSILVSIQLAFFLFSKKDKVFKKHEKWLYLIGYIILPFIILTKIPIGVDGYNPRILIGIFILIWTNDTFAYIVGKSIGKSIS